MPKNSDTAPQTIVAESRGYSPSQRADALAEALPYLQRFRGAIIVVKIGGNALASGGDSETILARFAEDIVMLRSVGLRPVVVHGGGPQIGDLLAQLGKQSEFSDGLRVTDSETLDVARMVLVGKVGRKIVGHINRHGAYAVGMSGEDGRLVEAEIADPKLGYVGQIIGVNPGIIQRLLAEDLIPVISSIGADADGQALNINADAVASAVGGALEAEKVIYLTNVAGLLSDTEDETSVVPKLKVPEIRTAIANGDISGGMLPKLKACVEAIEGGASSVHLLDGRVPRVLLLELFTDAGIGTMITA